VSIRSRNIFWHLSRVNNFTGTGLLYDISHLTIPYSALALDFVLLISCQTLIFLESWCPFLYISQPLVTVRDQNLIVEDSVAHRYKLEMVSR
jgi:hypothetical protein